MGFDCHCTPFTVLSHHGGFCHPASPVLLVAWGPHLPTTNHSLISKIKRPSPALWVYVWPPSCPLAFLTAPPPLQNSNVQVPCLWAGGRLWKSIAHHLFLTHCFCSGMERTLTIAAFHFSFFSLKLSHCLFTNQYLFRTYCIRHFEEMELK